MFIYIIYLNYNQSNKYLVLKYKDFQKEINKIKFFDYFRSILKLQLNITIHNAY